MSDDRKRPGVFLWLSAGLVAIVAIVVLYHAAFGPMYWLSSKLGEPESLEAIMDAAPDLPGLLFFNYPNPVTEWIDDGFGSYINWWIQLADMPPKEIIY